MLHIHNISKSYGIKPLFSDVSFTVGEKEKIGIIGRNGYGKSTLFNIITGEELPDEGSIDIPDWYSIRKLEQHLRFEKDTLLDQVAFGLPQHEKDEIWRAKSILMGLGFQEDDFTKSPFDFSSGYQIRIRLAQALVSQCELLLLDEPTNYLDIVSLRWLSQFLRNWEKSFLLITHDIGFMESVVTHSAIIHRGKIRKMKGSPSKLLDQIEKDEEVYEKTRLGDVKKQAKTEHFIKNFRAGARSAGLVQSRIKMLDKQEKREKLEKLPQIKFNFPAIQFNGDFLMEAHNIDFGYTPENLLIKKLNFAINGNDRIAIIGRNGKGKSTLLRLLSEAEKPLSGHFKKYHTLTRGYFGQEAENTVWNEETILSEFFSVKNIKETQARNIGASLLFTGNDIKKKISQLSGGERARVRLGKLMLKQHHLLLLDEPTNHLDIESVQRLIESLEKFEGSLVIISHDERLLSRVANKLIVFDHDEISVLHGGYEEFLEKGGWGDDIDINGGKDKKNDDDENSAKNQFKQRKENQKRHRQVISQQKNKEDANEENQKTIEKLSFKLHKAIRNADSPLVAKIGKEIKKVEEEIKTNEEEIENLILEELELEELLEI